MMDESRWAPPRPEDLAGLRQVKLRLPTEHVMKLHRLRILTSESISSVVAEALDDYFEQVKARRQAEKGGVAIEA